MRKFIGLGVVALSLAFAGSALASDGAAIFKSKCSPCHGAEGQGTAMAPAFKGNAFITGSKDGAEIAATIKEGRAGAAKKYKNFAIAMPAQKALTDDDIKAVIGVLKELAAKK